mmetsp:Transcript_929/g.1871  ORF Transcript_929/g.1871 Transcript_929/m.1871 type:complete len:201 (+) Transcript_929:534-1136(+)
MLSGSLSTGAPGVSLCGCECRAGVASSTSLEGLISSRGNGPQVYASCTTAAVALACMLWLVDCWTPVPGLSPKAGGARKAAAADVDRSLSAPGDVARSLSAPGMGPQLNALRGPAYALCSAVLVSPSTSIPSCGCSALSLSIVSRSVTRWGLHSVSGGGLYAGSRALRSSALSLLRSTCASPTSAQGHQPARLFSSSMLI